MNIEAEIQILDVSHLGKDFVRKSGWRPNHNFFNDTTMGVGQINFKNCEFVYPGDVVRAEIHFIPWDRMNSLEEGDVWSIQEGNKKIATGKILRIDPH